MGLSVDYLYQFALKLIRKNQSGSISGGEFCDFWNDQQQAYMGDLLGRFQNRSNGKEGGNTGLILNESILTKLSPFIKPYSMTITDGVCDKPSDFIYRLALRINGYDVYFINHGQIASVNNSVIDAPSITNNSYYAVEYQDYYLFLPNTVTAASLDYVINPENVVWGFTYDVDGRQIYNSGTSVQPQWDNLSNMEITKRMLENIGISLKDKDFENFGNIVEATGN